MNKLTLDQFKTETQNEVKNEARLTLDQFKKNSLNDKSEELEKLTGGTMASCHTQSTLHQVADDLTGLIRGLFK